MLASFSVKDAIVPIITLLGLFVPQIVGGTIVVERIFDIDGMGLLVWRSALLRDLPVLQACILIFTIVTLLALLVSGSVAKRLQPTTRIAS